MPRECDGRDEVAASHSPDIKRTFSTPQDIPFLSGVQQAGPALPLYRLQRFAEHVHRCGPRAIGELLLELIQRHGGEFEADLVERLETYSRLRPEILAQLGGTHFPPAPLRAVPNAGAA